MLWFKKLNEVYSRWKFFRKKYGLGVVAGFLQGYELDKSYPIDKAIAKNNANSEMLTWFLKASKWSDNDLALVCYESESAFNIDVDLLTGDSVFMQVHGKVSLLDQLNHFSWGLYPKLSDKIFKKFIFYELREFWRLHPNTLPEVVDLNYIAYDFFSDFKKSKDRMFRIECSFKIQDPGMNERLRLYIASRMRAKNNILLTESMLSFKCTLDLYNNTRLYAPNFNKNFKSQLTSTSWQGRYNLLPTVVRGSDVNWSLENYVALESFVEDTSLFEVYQNLYKKEINNLYLANMAFGLNTSDLNSLENYKPDIFFSRNWFDSSYFQSFIPENNIEPLDYSMVLVSPSSGHHVDLKMNLMSNVNVSACPTIGGGLVLEHFVRLAFITSSNSNCIGLNKNLLGPGYISISTAEGLLENEEVEMKEEEMYSVYKTNNYDLTYGIELESNFVSGLISYICQVDTVKWICDIDALKNFSFSFDYPQIYFFTQNIFDYRWGILCKKFFEKCQVWEFPLTFINNFSSWFKSMLLLRTFVSFNMGFYQESYSLNDEGLQSLTWFSTLYADDAYKRTVSNGIERPFRWLSYPEMSFNMFFFNLKNNRNLWFNFFNVNFNKSGFLGEPACEKLPEDTIINNELFTELLKERYFEVDDFNYNKKLLSIYSNKIIKTDYSKYILYLDNIIQTHPLVKYKNKTDYFYRMPLAIHILEYMFNTKLFSFNISDILAVINNNPGETINESWVLDAERRNASKFRLTVASKIGFSFDHLNFFSFMSGQSFEEIRSYFLWSKSRSYEELTVELDPLQFPKYLKEPSVDIISDLGGQRYMHDTLLLLFEGFNSLLFNKNIVYTEYDAYVPMQPDPFFSDDFNVSFFLFDSDKNALGFVPKGTLFERISAFGDAPYEKEWGLDYFTMGANWDSDIYVWYNHHKKFALRESAGFEFRLNKFVSHVGVKAKTFRSNLIVNGLSTSSNSKVSRLSVDKDFLIMEFFRNRYSIVFELLFKKIFPRHEFEVWNVSYVEVKTLLLQNSGGIFYLFIKNFIKSLFSSKFNELFTKVNSFWQKVALNKTLCNLTVINIFIKYINSIDKIICIDEGVFSGLNLKSLGMYTSIIRWKMFFFSLDDFMYQNLLLTNLKRKTPVGLILKNNILCFSDDLSPNIIVKNYISDFYGHRCYKSSSTSSIFHDHDEAFLNSLYFLLYRRNMAHLFILVFLVVIAPTGDA